jgi:hypothetical protein
MCRSVTYPLGATTHRAMLRAKRPDIPASNRTRPVQEKNVYSRIVDFPSFRRRRVPRGNRVESCCEGVSRVFDAAVTSRVGTARLNLRERTWRSNDAISLIERQTVGNANREFLHPITLSR